MFNVQQNMETSPFGHSSVFSLNLSNFLLCNDSGMRDNSNLERRVRHLIFVFIPTEGKQSCVEHWSIPTVTSRHQLTNLLEKLR